MSLCYSQAQSILVYVFTVLALRLWRSCLSYTCNLVVVTLYYTGINTCKVGSSLTINLKKNKHKLERQGCVYVVLKISGFKYQWKPRAFLCRKTLPPGYKAYHLQMEFASTALQWREMMATWTRCPILYAPPQTAVPLSKYLITSFTPENVLIQKLYHLVLLLDFSAIG